MENNQVQVFENTEFGKVRTVVIDGEPWFVVSDICEYFKVSNRNRVMQTIDAEDKEGTQMDTPGGKQNIAIVNESGLYSMLFALQPTKARGVSEEYIKERTEQLHQFKHWVTHDILPTIRKTGGYVANDDLFILTYLPSADEATKLLFKTTLETMRNLNAQNEKLKQEVEHKENIIVGLVKDIDLADKRQRITQIIRKGQSNGSAISARYALLYTEFEKKYRVNLSVRLENYKNSYKPRLKNYLDVIDKRMNMIPELYEICCKLFENEYNEIMKTWQSAINTENIE